MNIYNINLILQNIIFLERIYKNSFVIRYHEKLS